MKNKLPEKNFSRQLIRWYQRNARDLPWRRTSDPYKIWISEVMLQQTTVKAVIPYYEAWLKEFPDLDAVVKAPVEKVLKVWQGLGYYQRAKNIHKAAQILVSQFHGKVPDNSDDLRKLPGFGPYTTGAVLSIAFGRRCAIIDANVRRVVMRQLAIEGDAGPGKDEAVGEFLERVMPRKSMSFFNQGLMELGALICRSRQPLCLLCPVKEGCLAYARGIQEIIPTPKSRPLKEIEVSVAVIERQGRYFIQKRGPEGLLADLWEFPGGKIELGETPRSAVIREVREELGVDVVDAVRFASLYHYYTQFKVKLHVWRCVLSGVPPTDATHRWVQLRDLVKFPMPSGSARIVDQLYEKRSKS